MDCPTCQPEDLRRSLLTNKKGQTSTYHVFGNSPPPKTTTAETSTNFLLKAEQYLQSATPNYSIYMTWKAKDWQQVKQPWKGEWKPQGERSYTGRDELPSLFLTCTKTPQEFTKFSPFQPYMGRSNGIQQSRNGKVPKIKTQFWRSWKEWDTWHTWVQNPLLKNGKVLSWKQWYPLKLTWQSCTRIALMSYDKL